MMALVPERAAVVVIVGDGVVVVEHVSVRTAATTAAAGVARAAGRTGAPAAIVVDGVQTS